MLVLHQPDEHGRQKRKDIGLEECDQQLETHHEQHEQHRAPGHNPVAEYKMSPTRARITKCPAVMLAKSRKHSANGLTIFPISSTGVMIIAMITAPTPVMPGGTITIVLR